MLPATTYLTAPDILRVYRPTMAKEPARARNADPSYSLWFRSAVATVVVLLSSLAVAAPSWAGPAGGC
jgi:hypothetical protein